MLKAVELFYSRRQRLLNQVSFQLNPGEILHIKGANGSGKTTLLKIVSGLLNPNKGCVYWQDKSIDMIKKLYVNNLLYIGHELGMKGALTVRENLHFLVKLFSKPLKSSIEMALAGVGLQYEADSIVEVLSAGQKRRAALAQLFLFASQLWLLDEPFTAMDQKSIASIEIHIKKHLDDGGMVLITSHQLINMSVQELYLGED